MRNRKVTGFTMGPYTLSSAGARPWIPLQGPFKGANVAAVATFSGTTNGTAVRVEGDISTSSTAPFLVMRIKSSQKSAQVASTSGVSAKFVSFLRLNTSGTFSAAKTATVWVVGTA